MRRHYTAIAVSSVTLRMRAAGRSVPLFGSNLTTIVSSPILRSLIKRNSPPARQESFMSSLKIVYHPHPALRWKSRDVTRIDAQFKDWVAQMFELMYEARGIGLAANQVALPYRVFVINPTGDKDSPESEQVFINPQIIRRNGSEEAEEGCLSLPEIYGPVTRAERICVEAFDLKGEGFQMDLSGLPARVVQHENDHLDGVMFTDRVPDATRQELEPLLQDLESQMQRQQAEGTLGTDEQLQRDLQRLQDERTSG